jgi:hypothetical protein
LSVHTGECEIIASKVGGLSVIVGTRVKEHAGSGEVLVSNTVKDPVADRASRSRTARN